MGTLICSTRFYEFDECKCDWPDDELDNHLFKVDNDIQPAITILNQKGYMTRYSCSGHSDGIFSNAYIMFDKPYQFEELPVDWRYDSFIYRGIKKEYRHVIKPFNLTNREIKRMDDMELYDYLDKVNNDLLDWVKKLEICSEKNRLPILPKTRYEKDMYRFSLEHEYGYFPPYECNNGI